jgi:CRISPR-associated protein Cmr1
MFLNGADGITPELRAPSIKGALRFWWRALHGHLPLADLKKVEGEIFGDTKQRSKVIIREPQEIDSGYTHLRYDGGSKAFMLPHKPAPQNRNDRDLRSIAKCFLVGSKFQIQLSLTKDVRLHLTDGSEYVFTFTNLSNLFKTICVLGGFGKRNRRAFGSVKITKTKINNEDWQPYLMPTTLKEIQNLIGSRFTINATLITAPNGVGNYPHIKTIEFGTISSDITKKVINDSHLVKETELRRCDREKDYKHNNKPNSRFDNAIGNGGRFASPIFVSTIETTEGLKSMITTLKAVPNGRFETEHENLQIEYKTKLKTN